MPDGPSKQQPKATATTRKPDPEPEPAPAAPEPEPAPVSKAEALPPLASNASGSPEAAPATIVTYVASLVTFLIGVLTLSGVTIPNSVSSGVQLWAGAAVTLAGPLISLVVYLAKVSFAKTAIQQGVPVHHAAKLA